jgi:glutaredoxin
VAAPRLSAGSPVVTLYGRDGCHLCEEARRSIVALDAELGGIELREVDIEADDRLLASYLERIPVVELDGREVSELEFDRDAFLDALHTVGA